MVNVNLMVNKLIILKLEFNYYILKILNKEFGMKIFLFDSRFDALTSIRTF